MERKFLEGLGLDKESIDKVLDANSVDIGKQKALAEAAEVKLSEAVGRVAQRDTELAALRELDAAGLKAELDTLQAKYDTERADWDAKEQRRAYELRRDAFFSEVPFADDYTRRGVLAEFDERAFAYSEADKSFTGADAWLESLRVQAPGAFWQEAKPPVVVRPIDGAPAAQPTKEAFAKMGYRERAALKQSNPELYQLLKE